MTIPTIRRQETTTGFSFQQWQENFLRVVLRGAVIFGLFALIPVLFTNIDSRLLIVYFIAYLALVVVAFVPNIPQTYRAATFIFLFYLLGASSLLNTGIWGGSRAFFVALVIVTGLLASPRAAVTAAFVSVLSTGIVAFLVINGLYHLSTSDLPGGDFAIWASGTGTIIMLDAIIITGLVLFQREFSSAQQRATQRIAELGAEQKELTKKLEAGEEEAQQKTREFQAAAKVARQIVEITNLGDLLNNITAMIAKEFNLYHAGIFLLDETKQFAVLQAVSSEGGKKMLEAGHRLEVGTQGIVGLVAERARPRIALDVGTDPVFFNNPHLPLTHSEMALPLIAREKTIGVLDVQSEKPQAFTQSDIDVLQTVADQLAIAIENARLLSETDTAIHEFESLTKAQAKEAWQEYLKERISGYQYTPLGIRPLTDGAQPSHGKTMKVALKLRGQQIGTLNLSRKAAGPDWTPREQDLVANIAGQIVLALDNSRLLEETQKNAARDQLVANVTSRIRETLDMETVLQTAAVELRKAFGLQEAEIRLGISTDENDQQALEPKRKKGAGSNGHKDLTDLEQD